MKKDRFFWGKDILFHPSPPKEAGFCAQAFQWRIRRKETIRNTKTPKGMPFGGFYIPKNLHKAYLWGSWYKDHFEIFQSRKKHRWAPSAAVFGPCSSFRVPGVKRRTRLTSFFMLYFELVKATFSIFIYHIHAFSVFMCWKRLTGSVFECFWWWCSDAMDSIWRQKKVFIFRWRELFVVLTFLRKNTTDSWPTA